MHGYSDRINHAFASAAKYYNVLAPAGAGVDYLAHPANVAVILSRYGCEQVTIVAGILHHVLEESPPDRWPVLEHKIGEKFGSVALAVAKDSIEPKYDRRGSERPWQPCKQEYLTQLATAEPRALDIIVADELHSGGSGWSISGRCRARAPSRPSGGTARCSRSWRRDPTGPGGKCCRNCGS